MSIERTCEMMLFLLPVPHDWEWLSWRTGALGERQATTLLLFPRVTLVCTHTHISIQVQHLTLTLSNLSFIGTLYEWMRVHNWYSQC